ncbi:Biopterin transporter family [Dillenia turbinata]|uniref:Biopterin transporter family n=1 Tax=Dillenia turbinata TaxID=194707 RepID=A0AAN8V522_9MAGN
MMIDGQRRGLLVFNTKNLSQVTDQMYFKQKTFKIPIQKSLILLSQIYNLNFRKHRFRKWVNVIFFKFRNKMIGDDEENNIQANAETEEQTGPRNGFCKFVMDVQKVQPTDAQIHSGVIFIPSIVKPIWGILTAVVPILGFRRRTYSIFPGNDPSSSFSYSLNVYLVSSPCSYYHFMKCSIVFLGIMALLAGNILVAFADATVDACIAENSITHPLLAPDLQSLCELSLSTGELIGFLISGILLH